MKLVSGKAWLFPSSLRVFFVFYMRNLMTDPKPTLTHILDLILAVMEVGMS